MTNGLLLYGSALAVAGGTAAFTTPLICRLATHVGMFDAIEDERRVHVAPTPRIGGVAVYIGFVFALFAVLGIALSQATNFFHDIDDIHQFLGLLFGSTLILGIGIWDDIMGMRARNKLLAQIVVALIAVLYGFVIKNFHVPFAAPDVYIKIPSLLGYLLTVIWYVGMMNAINFIDGLDGLLGGVTAIASIFMVAIALTHHSSVVGLVMVSLAGAALGFLPYNFNPAKIFLGDSGSLFIGFIFATVAVMGEGAKQAVAISILVPLIMLALPVLDTAFAIVRRARSGKRITDADRGHFHHQLIFRYGLNVRQAVLLMYAVCFVFGALALVVSGGLHRLSKIAGV
ncbi:MAG: undecaprenyl-phosphate alpha-N-acetylglucosaminyl 1-phosphate transferase [Candidatus Meridianibacter frigidus]|nr:MAG: undecaprenyl-phosphate alpha-N-acetylglucosaminyl 1-phosphate transferase [Candidatus Eremiobacteraeota bacterium]